MGAHRPSCQVEGSPRSAWLRFLWPQSLFQVSTASYVSPSKRSITVSNSRCYLHHGKLPCIRVMPFAPHTKHLVTVHMCDDALIGDCWPYHNRLSACFYNKVPSFCGPCHLQKLGTSSGTAGWLWLYIIRTQPTTSGLQMLHPSQTYVCCQQ